MSKERVFISDTTLRDGEQAPGFSMFPHEKLELAMQLERLGVDRIEAGFPAASLGEHESVSQIARALKRAEVMAFARVNVADVDTAWRALDGATNPVLHVCAPASDLHLAEKMHWTRQECLDRSAAALRRARSLAGKVQFALEDSSRADPEFVTQLVKLAVEERVHTLNYCDTVGYILPHEWEEQIRRVLAVPGMENIIVSLHCHNDLGLAVANVLAGLRAGARQVEGTINGCGERAGNAALEEIVMTLRTRDVGLDTNIEATEIFKTSRMLSAITGINVQPNKAVVGRNAFSHEAGIHQAGIIKNPLTYEIMSAESVGLKGRTFVLGKHSGRAGLDKRLRELGVAIEGEELAGVYEKFCHLADRKKVILDSDLLLLVKEHLRTAAAYLELLSLTYVGLGEQATATLKLRKGTAEVSDSATGAGPFEACAAAICRIVGHEYRTEDVECVSTSRGRDCLARVVVQISDRGGEIFAGQGAGIDLVYACAAAYVSAVNAALAAEKRNAATHPADVHIRAISP